MNRTTVSWQDLAVQTSASHSPSDLGGRVHGISGSSKEIIYLSLLTENLGLRSPDEMSIGEDNTACIEWGDYLIGGRERASTSTSGSTSPTMQCRRRNLCKVASRDQPADVLAKSLTHERHDRSISGHLRQGHTLPLYKPATVAATSTTTCPNRAKSSLKRGNGETAESQSQAPCQAPSRPRTGPQPVNTGRAEGPAVDAASA